jgi:4-diphosphocytidyl-2-C-methyl-D-erythritol kinase
MKVLAPGKVNLCLFLGPVRPDGRHELVTLLESVSLADELSVEFGAVDQVVCADVPGPNLVDRAIGGLRELGWAAPPVQVTIVKRVPVAAGMGGGSADAAAMLRVAPKLAPVSADGVARLAASLGADVPSQLTPGVALGTGAGEVVERVDALAPHAFVILPSPHSLSTADVYAEADRLGLGRDAGGLSVRLAELRSVLSIPGSRLSEVNDLEPAAVSLCPSIAAALEGVRAAGADHALVCGSGPTVAGVFWGADAGSRAAVVADELSGSWPGAVATVPVDASFGAPA